MTSEKATGPIAIFGARGQLGEALGALCRSDAAKWGEVRALDREEVDIGDPGQVLSCIEKLQPRAILNAAAYTAVDQAESDLETARQVNTLGPTALASCADELGIPLIHYSTDYVFSGEGSEPWKESDLTDPRNIYGMTKRSGEISVEGRKPRSNPWAVLRTSWVFDASHRNFFTTLVKLFRERETMEVVDDQVGAPTYAPDLARASLKILETMLSDSTHARERSGIYHACNTGFVSRYDYARFVLAEGLERGLPFVCREIRPVSTDRFPTPARRPLNSRLDTSLLKKTWGVELPPWQDAVKRALEDLKP